MASELRCPPIAEEDLAPDATSDRLEKLLRDLDARSDAAPRYFGREIRVAFGYLESLNCPTKQADPADDRLQLLRRVFTRPASEPILYSVWPRFCGGLQSIESYVALVSMLSSKSVQVASSRMRTAGEEGDALVFEERVSAATWLQDIAETREGQGCTIRRAIYAYVRTVLAHPLTDGNGRLARAMLQFELGAQGILDGPKLPVAPTFYVSWEGLTAHLRDLSANGSWAAYFGAVLPRLAEAAEAALQDTGTV